MKRPNPISLKCSCGTIVHNCGSDSVKITCHKCVAVSLRGTIVSETKTDK